MNADEERLNIMAEELRRDPAAFHRTYLTGMLAWLINSGENYRNNPMGAVKEAANFYNKTLKAYPQMPTASLLLFFADVMAEICEDRGGVLPEGYKRVKKPINPE